MKKRTSPLEIFSRQIHFHTQWVGNQRLNERGLHLARIRLSNMCLSARQLPFPRFQESETFKRDGIIAIENFLPQAQFDLLQNEVRQTALDFESKYPFAANTHQLFGPKQFFEQGFDRYDGSTLNRFIDISAVDTPQSYRFINDAEVTSRARKTSGSWARNSKFSIYQTVHGSESDIADTQKNWHRDSFQRCVKMWFYIDDVTSEQGPFEYIPGSHLMTKDRLDWEYEQSVAAASPGGSTGGSFRINESEFSRLKLRQPKSYSAPANTLVLADVRGFHRRGLGEAGKRRLSIYANFRPFPFLPIALG